MSATKHEMEVTIDEDGNVTIEAHGIQGRACLTALGELLKALGKEKAAPTPTREMYQTNAPTMVHKGGLK